MSAASDVAVLVPASARGGSRRVVVSTGERPLARLVSFAALALYGTVRWATLIEPAPVGRLLGLYALSLFVVGAGILLRGRGRVLMLVVAAVAVVAAFALAGVPLAWVRHMRVAVTANGIGQGLSDLPRVLLPYLGINQWIRTVMVLGAGLLLLAAALTVALTQGRIGDRRRAVAASALIALAVVPSTLVHPQLPYLQGLILFLLVAGFIWAERVRHGEALVAGGLALVAGAAGMAFAPALNPHHPWLNYQALANNLEAHSEAFDWTQRYGPLHWPRTGKEVLEVQAPRPDYWKAENLDVFNGRGWVNDSVQAEDAQYTVSAANVQRWTQSLHVTLRAMKTHAVIAAGTAQAPLHVQGAVGGLSQGTWLAPSGLGPGDSYDVTAYDPHPSAAQLQSAGTDYPSSLLPAYLALMIPADPKRPAGGVGIGSASQGQPPSAAPAQPAIIAPFGSQLAFAYSPSTPSSVSLLQNSPYARAYALATRLARESPTPYAFVTSVKRYLDSGAYTYDENPPASRYPLETFLFSAKRGYCQQFAGAMALLLRLGGVPARVATGFTTGSYDNATHSWIISDTDAHAWVEAWFPRYGWVRFEPTPAAAPALGGHVPLPAVKGAPGSGSTKPSAHGVSTSAGITSGTVRRAGGGTPLVALLAAAAVAALIAVAIRVMVRLSAPTDEQLLVELERAFARCGRRMPEGTTLASLEHRLRASEGAEAYVRTIRLSRFGGVPGAPSSRQRRALRGQLRSGLGLLGRARVLWALPPRFYLRLPVLDRQARGINSM